MGGYVALEVAACLEAAERPAPRVIIGATPPPHCRDEDARLAAKDDAALYAWVQSLQALPDGGGSSRELFEAFKKPLRADVSAFETYDFRHPPLRKTQVNSVSGRKDLICPPEAAREWARYGREVSHAVIEGAHLFVTEEPQTYGELMARLIETSS